MGTLSTQWTLVCPMRRGALCGDLQVVHYLPNEKRYVFCDLFVVWSVCDLLALYLWSTYDLLGPEQWSTCELPLWVCLWYHRRTLYSSPLWSPHWLPKMNCYTWNETFPVTLKSVKAHASVISLQLLVIPAASSAATKVITCQSWCNCLRLSDRS